jgi:hypothetical protein
MLTIITAVYAPLSYFYTKMFIVVVVTGVTLFVNMLLGHINSHHKISPCEFPPGT